MSIKQLLAALLITVTLCAASWGAAFWITGDRLDCQREFCALRTKHGTGVSVQWAGGLTVWMWDGAGENNRRVWPGGE